MSLIFKFQDEIERIQMYYIMKSWIKIEILVKPLPILNFACVGGKSCETIIYVCKY